MVGRQWTKEELRLLIENYSNSSTEEVQKRFLPQKSLMSIGKMAQHLRMGKSEEQLHKSLEKLIEASRKPRTWTQKQNALLKKHYPNTPLKKLVRLLPKHSAGAIRAQANLMGLKRSKNFISQCKRVEIYRKKPWLGSKNLWTEDEVKKLEGEYPKKSIFELMEILPRHSRSGITEKAHKLGLHKSGDYLLTQRQKNSQRGREFLEKKRRMNPKTFWSVEEEDTLRKIYYEGERLEILKRLIEKTWGATKQKARRLGLSRDLSNAIKMSLRQRGVNPASWTQKKPTKTEKRVIKIVKRHSFPFKYVGDGKVRIRGLCPDFISSDGSKKLIEVFGRAFHDPENSFVKVRPYHTKEGRQTIFKKEGWDCLIFWDDELDDEKMVVNRIEQFLNRD